MTITVTALAPGRVIVATDGMRTWVSKDGALTAGGATQKILTDDARRIAISVGGLGTLGGVSILVRVEALVSQYKGKPTAHEVARWLGHKMSSAVVSEVRTAREQGATAMYGVTLYVAAAGKRGASLAESKIELRGVTVTERRNGVYLSPPKCLTDFYTPAMMPTFNSPALLREITELIGRGIVAERMKHNGTNVDCGYPIQSVEIEVGARVSSMIWEPPAQ